MAVYTESKFQKKLITLLGLSILIPLGLTSSYNIYSSSNFLSQVIEGRMEVQGQDSAQNINLLVDTINSDIIYLTKVPPIQGIIRSRANKGIDPLDQSTYQSWINRMETIFVSFMESRPYYQKLQFLDENGQELAYAEMINGVARIVNSESSQDYGGSEYVKGALGLKPGEVYVSDVQLDRENGQIKQPYQPITRYATPVHNQQGQVKGIVVSTIVMDPLFQLADNQIGGVDSFNESQPQRSTLASPGGNGSASGSQNLTSGENMEFLSRQELTIVNGDGYYLVHPNSEKTWGFELGKDERIQNDLPSQMATEILTQPYGFISQGTQNLLSYYRINPSYTNTNKPIILIYSIPKDFVFAGMRNMRNISIAISLLSLALALPIGLQILRQVMQSLMQFMGTVSDFSQQLSTMVAEQERMTSQQSASVHETTTTMDQLHSSSQQSSQQAEAASLGAQKALKQVEIGQDQVRYTLTQMATLKSQVDAIVTQVQHLNEQANQVNVVSSLVSELANQTNMLALNAAVEAVRAGENGKGFAVVAAEIRKLADESQKSGEKIGDLVADIQKAVVATVTVTDHGRRNVDQGVVAAQQTADAFEDIALAIQQMADGNQMIALNSKQQADAIRQVTLAMSQISSVASETAEGLQQTKAGTQRLNLATQQLRSVV